MHFFKDVISLLLPNKCILCDTYLLDREKHICLVCGSELPLTYYWERQDNYLKQLFEKDIKLESASSLTYFHHGSTMQELLHRIKYFGERISARVLGEMYGYYISGSVIYSGIDTIVPIPLHYGRFFERGYNQAEEFAYGISKVLGAKVESSLVRRIVKTSQQAKKNSGEERWKNVEGVFRVVKPSGLEGRKVLLVDDVITTGSTLISCAKVMQSSAKFELYIGSISMVLRSTKE